MKNPDLEIIRHALDLGIIDPSELLKLQKENMPFTSNGCSAQTALKICDKKVAEILVPRIAKFLSQ